MLIIEQKYIYCDVMGMCAYVLMIVICIYDIFELLRAICLA